MCLMAFWTIRKQYTNSITLQIKAILFKHSTFLVYKTHFEPNDASTLNETSDQLNKTSNEITLSVINF